MSRHRGPSESSVGSIRRQGSDAAPCQRGIVAEPALEQTGKEAEGDHWRAAIEALIMAAEDHSVLRSSFRMRPR